MFRSSKASPLSVVLIIGLLVVFLSPPRATIPETEAAAIRARFGVRPGAMIVFHMPGCGACDVLFGQLDSAGIPYTPVNIRASQRAFQTLRDLGKNAFGVTTSAPTPTSLVGRRVIRGANLEAIRKALGERGTR